MALREPPIQNPPARSKQSVPATSPWQFSLLTLMKVTTAVAVLLALVSLLPEFVSQILIGAVWIVGIGWLITGIVFAHGRQRAFCIGAMVVASSIWTSVGARFVEGFSTLFVLFGIHLPVKLSLWIDLFVVLAAGLANGLLCVRAYNYFQRRNAASPDS